MRPCSECEYCRRDTLTNMTGSTHRWICMRNHRTIFEFKGQTRVFRDLLPYWCEKNKVQVRIPGL